ncbi:putative OsmC-like protein/TusA-related sulfurtransferase [Caldalkalibacillus uzonensis]|uniref:OsmC-like protein/TusA-related sulfurtransferase n=1 Tax=Caldalkalibacillus uzonensis TaxID=353224 RepID=A0ABU0CXB5_9BACI|nr:OsmC family protein [Caldalkalibacillus uzonensis]MDQ0339842.1 putative OsmC-like protein/TusA-related sulfurtransferase [Caldalkalibacillus uzonensis]
MIMKADAMCDGGDLDCGSGLLLIIKKNMDPLAPGQVLEVRSRERSVAEDLPAWCRMVEHEYLGAEPGVNWTSYFIKKGGQDDQLEQDLEAARGYQWSVRIQGEEGLTAKVHARNHTFYAGQPADFGSKVDAPSAIDYLLAALGSDLAVGFKAIASRQHIEIDELELTLKGGLDNVLYHLQLEDEGTPRLKAVSGTMYVSSPAEEEELQVIWETTLQRSPVYQTLKEAVNLDVELKIVY